MLIYDSNTFFSSGYMYQDRHDDRKEIQKCYKLTEFSFVLNKRDIYGILIYNFSKSDIQKYTRRLWDAVSMEKALYLYNKGGISLENAGKKYKVPPSSLHTR